MALKWLSVPVALPMIRRNITKMLLTGLQMRFQEPVALINTQTQLTRLHIMLRQVQKSGETRRVVLALLWLELVLEEQSQALPVI